MHASLACHRLHARCSCRLICTRPVLAGGFIPARMLRTFLKQKSGKALPIQTIGLVLYDENDPLHDPTTAAVRKTQVSMGGGAGALGAARR